MLSIVYIRVSTEDQARHGYSLAEQEDAGAARARALGYTPDQILVIADEGVSGEILERPGLIRLRELIRAGGVGHLILRDLDRLSRKLMHQLLLTEEIERFGCRIEFLSFDWQDTPEGRLFLSMRGAVAEYEKAKIRERTMTGKLRKAKQGGLPHVPRHYGYSYDKETDTLSPHPEQAAVVRQIYSWYADEDMSCDRIARRLNEMGVPTARKGRWMQKTVDRILRNPVYKGDLYVNTVETYGMAYNRYRPKEARVRPRPRPAAEHIRIDVPAIVDADLWERAQSVRGYRRRLHDGLPVEFYLLTGLVRCGVCGKPMHGYRHRSNNKGRWIRYYCCAGKLGRYRDYQGTACINPLIQADALEARVWALVVQWITDPDTLLEARRQEEPPAPIAPDEAALVEGQLAELREEREKILGLYVKDLIPREDGEKRLEALRDREAFLFRRLAELRPARPARAPVEEEDVRANCARLAEEIADATDRTRKRLTRIMIEGIRVEFGRVEILANLPRAGDVVAKA